MLSSIQLAQKIQEVPVIELSYENSTSHNKVCDSYQVVLAIPRSKKYIAWFTFFEEHDICILLELNREKQIVSYRQINVVFDTQEPHLALGTFLYGSMIHEIENDMKCSFFVIEDILIYRGVSVRKLTFGDRLGILYHILRDPTVLANSSGDLRSPSELVVQRLTAPLPESDTDINITDLETEEQYSDFTHLNHTKLAPFLKRYFSPSNEIESIIDSIEYKYNIQYENTCVLFFRGNDKCTEMELPSYTQYILAAEQILKQHPNIRFLVQSDETEFLETMVSTFPNSVVFFDEIRHMRRNVNTVDRVFKSQNANMSLFYLAITYIMSRCKHIIFNRGNCSLWIALFRGNSDNIIQLFV